MSRNQHKPVDPPTLEADKAQDQIATLTRDRDEAGAIEARAVRMVRNDPDLVE